MTKSTSGAPRVKMGSSCQVDCSAAVRELSLSIAQPDIGLVIIFASPVFDLDQLASQLKERFGLATVIGCTTAGEIGPAGYFDGSLSGVSIHRDDLTFEVGILERLASTNFQDAQHFAYQLKDSLRKRVADLTATNAFAFMLIDGLCSHEEWIVRAFYDGLGGIPLVGGSAGDDLAFKQTWVLDRGRFVSDAAILLLATTPFPFTVFKTQHFVSSDQRMVVTEAIPEKRIVIEINGCPAADEYARALGLDICAVDSMTFATHPVVVRIGDADFVRSIQKINPDGSLTFYCAIDEGIVFRLANGVDMVDNLKTALEAVVHKIGPPSLILGCDCILRHLETKQRGNRDHIGSLLAENKVVGFSTYGEQFCGIHVNQTFTGIAIGSKNPA
jgi:hypothetical protein